MNYPRLTVKFEDIGTVPSEVRVYSDSDWAGCLRTRRSTSGGCVTLNGTAIKNRSTMQPTIALSSGEAELTAFVKGSLACDMGLELTLVVVVDSSAAVEMVNRDEFGTWT